MARLAQRVLCGQCGWSSMMSSLALSEGQLAIYPISSLELGMLAWVRSGPSSRHRVNLALDRDDRLLDPLQRCLCVCGHHPMHSIISNSRLIFQITVNACHYATPVLSADYCSDKAVSVSSSSPVYSFMLPFVSNLFLRTAT